MPDAKMPITKAIVRPPGPGFHSGLTTADLGVPHFGIALTQHESYCRALEACGAALTRLPPDEAHPDSTFVEDTAVLAPGVAVLTRPGAPSRRGEVTSIREALKAYFDRLEEIRAPGTLDGGDVCLIGSHAFIGISERTNEDGARQLAAILAGLGIASDLVDIRGVAGILHLKSGVSSLGDGRVVVIEALADHPALSNYVRVVVHEAEEYASNCLTVNDTILMPAGHPRLQAKLEAEGCRITPLDMSEFRKMDGGLTCLSLRF